VLASTVIQLAPLGFLVGNFFIIVVGVSRGNISKTGFVFVYQVVNGEWDPILGPLERAGF
jgi:hypothetical protein